MRHTPFSFVGNASGLEVVMLSQDFDILLVAKAVNILTSRFEGFPKLGEVVVVSKQILQGEIAHA